MNEDMIVRFSVSSRTIILVSGEVKFIWIFSGDNRLTCVASAYMQECYCFRSVYDKNGAEAIKECLFSSYKNFLYDENKHSLYIMLSCL